MDDGRCLEECGCCVVVGGVVLVCFWYCRE